MRHGSLFSGIGGFDLAAEWMGWENVFHCEWNPFCQKILKHYWPNAKSYGDITKTDFTEWKGRIDIVSGGFPCQPYSIAGKRKGKEDDRHLWPEMLRAIREIQPSWVVGENVPGLLNWKRGMVFDEIKTDLEAAGFEVFPALILPACGKNAPHRRDRLWVVAYSKSNISRDEFRDEGYKTRKVSEKRPNKFIIAADTGLQRSPKRKKQTTGVEQCYKKNVTNPNNQGSQRGTVNGSIRTIGKERNQQFAGLFQTEWEIFPTQSPICGGDDGVPDRVDRIKSLGNAVVPQVVYEIFKAIEQFESYE